MGSVRKAVNAKNMIVIFLSFVLVFCIGHADANAVVTWGVEFLRHVQGKNLYYYTVDLQTMGMPTNYGIFVNACTGILVLPLYVFELLGKTVSLVQYITWYKIILLLFLYLNICCMKRILSLRNMTDGQKEEAIILFGSSLVVWFYAIAMGQVDLVALFFMLHGIEQGLKEHHYKMAILLSCAVMVKAFPIFFAVPLFLYLFKKQFLGKEKKEYVIPCLCFLLPMVAEKGVRTFCIQDYEAFSNMVNTADFLPKIIRWSVAGVPLVILCMLLILLVYFIFLLQEKATGISGVICCTGMMYGCFYFFVEWSPQYLLYGMPFLFLILVRAWDDVTVWKIGAVIQWGLFFLCVGGYNVLWTNSMLVQNSLVGQWLQPTEFYISSALPTVVAKAMLYGGRLLVNVIFLAVPIFCRRERKANFLPEEQMESKWSLLYLLPTILYLGILMSNYLR